MQKWTKVCLPLCLALVFGPLAMAQESTQAQSTETQTGPSAPTDIQARNLQSYINLLRSDVRQQKAEIMGAVLQLDIDQSAKFWPIYSEYDAELTKLNNLRLANIQDYAKNYDQMTDAKADELIQKALDYRKQRAELVTKYYGRVKTALGSIEAARFLQVEDQLLMIIDLQIASSLPIAAQGS
jgi:hypothetical protein